MSAAMVELIGLLGSEALPVALCGARWLPLVVAHPLFGAGIAPMPARLGLVLSMAWMVRSALGEVAAVPPGPELLLAFVRELTLGVGLAVLAGLPLEAARAAGRLVDAMAGDATEWTGPLGGKESPSAALLHLGLCAGLFTSGLHRPLLEALLGSHHALPLGAALPTSWPLLFDAATRTLESALRLGAPAAALMWTLEGLGALASRWGGGLRAAELIQAARLLGVRWLLGLGLSASLPLLLEELAATTALLP